MVAQPVQGMVTSPLLPHKFPPIKYCFLTYTLSNIAPTERATKLYLN